MGIDQAKAVSALHGALPGGPFKALLRMALVSLDRPNEKGQPPGLYFGGWEQLAVALGFPVPDDDGTPEARRRRKKLRGYVTDAIRVLVEAGVIERVGERARIGTRATYRLKLSGPQEAGSTRPPESQVLDDPGSEVHLDPTIPVLSTPLPGVPRKDLGEIKDLIQDTTTPSSTGAYEGTRGVVADWMTDEDEQLAKVEVPRVDRDASTVQAAGQ